MYYLFEIVMDGSSKLNKNWTSQTFNEFQAKLTCIQECGAQPAFQNLFCTRLKISTQGLNWVYSETDKSCILLFFLEKVTRDLCYNRTKFKLHLF